MNKVIYGVLLFSLFSASRSYAIENMDLLIKEYQSILDKKYILLPHEEIYLLPYSFNENPNNDIYKNVLGHDVVKERGDFTKKSEVEFQFSFSILLNRNAFNSDFSVFLGYTHTSWWQIYNTGWSRQFRETNYTPSIFARKIFEKPKKFLGISLLAYDFGYIHQSNGQIQELSRSWDRLFLRMAFGVKHFVFVVNTWTRLRIMDQKIDDNPDILDYRGYGDFKVKYYDKKNIYSLKITPGKKYFGSEVSYSHPITEGVRFFTKINYGYGHSLIDNKNKEKRIGLGFTLSDFLSMY